MYRVGRRSAKDLSTTLLSWLESSVPVQTTATQQQQSRVWIDKVTHALSSRQYHGTAAQASMHGQSPNKLRPACWNAHGIARMIASSSSAHVHQSEVKEPSRGDNHATTTQDVSEHPPEQPPGVLTTITAMGAGAGGAVLVAAIGVWAVFQMAFWVAGEAGRSIKTTDAASLGVGSEPTTHGGEDSPIQSTPA